jgi:hypothetical protein
LCWRRTARSWSRESFDEHDSKIVALMILLR